MAIELLTDALIRGDDPLVRAFVLGKAGALANATNSADFRIMMPFDFTLQRMKVITQVAPTGAMVVQLRRATAYTNSSPTFSDVTGFVITMTANEVGKVVDPTDVDVNENDLFDFSLATATGTSILVVLVGKMR